MANGDDLYRTNKPGPDPVFTERMELRLRKDQMQTLNRLSSALDMHRSELVRLILDQGIAAVDQAHQHVVSERYA